jgi:hypothetical protein
VVALAILFLSNRKGIPMTRDLLVVRRSILFVVALAAWASVAASVFAATSPTALDLDKASAEVKRAYGKAHPEVQEFVLHTARSFGRSGMWLNEDAYAALKPGEREERVAYLAKLLEEAEYGRHLSAALAEAGAIKDARLLKGLSKVAGYQVEGKDYDCRPKWMAVAALARQESADAVPLLVSLVDHGNQNTRLWARAALSRMAGEDFGPDKAAWNKWWVGKGHEAIDAKLLKPYTPPAAQATPAK